MATRIERRITALEQRQQRKANRKLKAAIQSLTTEEIRALLTELEGPYAPPSHMMRWLVREAAQ